MSSDWDNGVPSMEDILVFWTLKAADDAAIGGVEIGSADESWSKLEAMTLFDSTAMVASAVARLVVWVAAAKWDLVEPTDWLRRPN